MADRSQDLFDVSDPEEAQLVSEVIDQIEINKRKIARIRSLITIERIHAVVGAICLLILAGLLVFALLSSFYPRVTRVDINPEILIAFIIPTFVVGAFGFLTFFTGAISRIHELRELYRFNLNMINLARLALDGDLEGVEKKGYYSPSSPV